MNATLVEDWRERLLIQHAELLHSDDRLVVHLAELHSPEGDRRGPECAGCDYQGNNAWQAPPWPCRTWSLLAEEVDR